MMAPAKTPREIIDRIANEFMRANKDPAVHRAARQVRRVAGSATPEQFAKFLQEDIALWAEAVKIAGVTLDSAN